MAIPDRFADSVRHHFSNPPHDWTVRKLATRRWAIVNTADDVISTHPTRTAAEQNRTAGPYVRIWTDRTAWYLGTSTDPRCRALTPDDISRWRVPAVDVHDGR